MPDNCGFTEPAHKSGHKKRERQCEQEVIVKESSGHVCLEKFRHYKSGIGADHHELAVSEVDHTHEAEDDRQAERQQDQDAAKRQASERVMDDAYLPLIALDVLECLLNSVHQLCLALLSRNVERG